MGGCRSSVPMLGTGGIPPVRGPALRGPARMLQVMPHASYSYELRISIGEGETAACTEDMQKALQAGCASASQSGFLIWSACARILLRSAARKSHALTFKSKGAIMSYGDSLHHERMYTHSGILGARFLCTGCEYSNLHAAGSHHPCLGQGCVMCQAHQRAGSERQAPQLPGWLPSQLQLAAAWQPPLRHAHERSASALPPGRPCSCSLPLDLHKAHKALSHARPPGLISLQGSFSSTDRWPLLY